METKNSLKKWISADDKQNEYTLQRPMVNRRERESMSVWLLLMYPDNHMARPFSNCWRAFQ